MRFSRLELPRQPIGRLARERGVHAENLVRASELAIEIGRELTRTPVERLPQLIALGRADLPYPAVLQRAQCHDQHDKGDRGEQRERKTRRGHDPESSMWF